MRHQRSGKKLGRDSAHRKALYSNLAGALIQHGRIETTEAKAKAVKPFAEKMITLGKRGDLHARRQALAALRSNNVVHTLFADIARASCGSAPARATPPRWSTSSSSTSSRSPRRSRFGAQRRPKKSPQPRKPDLAILRAHVSERSEPC